MNANECESPLCCDYTPVISDHLQKAEPNEDSVCDFTHLACDDDLSAGDQREVSERELCPIWSFMILFKYYNVTWPTDASFSSYKTSYLEHNVYIFGSDNKSDNTAETFASHSVTCGLIA